ncbi:MAG: hypothetical protein KDE63_09400 [Novosphingobium sp.]|nr:hypothetical protein [Novosphingobium sp.]
MLAPQNPPQEASGDERIALAARWLLEQAELPRPIVPALRARFGLDAQGACAAIAELGKLRKAAMLGASR